MRLDFHAKVWLYPGASAAWHFISLPKKDRDAVRKRQENKPRRGWGAVKVTATIGESSWQTSIFPDKKSDTYLLPLKSEIRKKERITHGDTISVILIA